MPRLEQSTRAAVTASRWGFGVLGMDGVSSGQRVMLPGLRTSSHGKVCRGGTRKAKKNPPTFPGLMEPQIRCDR